MKPRRRSPQAAAETVRASARSSMSIAKPVAVRRLGGGDCERRQDFHGNSFAKRALDNGRWERGRLARND